MSTETTTINAKPPCTCNVFDCDECHDRAVAENPTLYLPWGWERGRWYEYNEGTYAAMLRPRGSQSRSLYELDFVVEEAQAWCIFVALLSIAAMALMHGAISEDGGAR